MKSLIFILIAIMFSLASYAQPYTSLWEIFNDCNNLPDNLGIDIGTDQWGNSYLTGIITGSVEFNFSHYTTNGGTTDIFLAKYDPSGHLKWLKRPGSNYIDRVWGIATDLNGNSYITGEIASAISFDGNWVYPDTSDGHYTDIFVAKYDSSGNCLWAKGIGSPNYDFGYRICIDELGNAYLTGAFTEGASFGGHFLTSNGDYDAFIAKYDQNGNCNWAKKIGGTGIDYGKGIAYKNGYLYVAGAFSQTVNFGSTSLTSSGDVDIFLTKCDTSGNVVWAKSAGGANEDQGTALTLDDAYTIYLSGYFNNSATFNAAVLTSSGQDQFLATYDSAGNYQSVIHYLSSHYGEDIAVRPYGNGRAQSGLSMEAGVQLPGDARGLAYDNIGNLLVTGNVADLTGDYSIFFYKINTSTGVQEFNTGNIPRFYPNPANSIVNIEFQKLPKGKICLYNFLGQKVLESECSKTTRINLQRIPEGFYSMQYTSESNRESLGVIQIIH